MGDPNPPKLRQPFSRSAEAPLAAPPVPANVASPEAVGLQGGEDFAMERAKNKEKIQCRGVVFSFSWVCVRFEMFL